MKKKTFADILSSISDRDLARMAHKVPEWSSVPGMQYPSGLSIEQCSSSETARYKADLCMKIFPSTSRRPRIADLTGGLGVDCWAFSRIAEQVHHNEMDAVLSAAVEANFHTLGIGNVTFSSMEAGPGRIASILGDINPDIIFIDPARRSCTGKKVFLLEDCHPDILRIKDELLDISPHVLVKLSPMADISMVCDRLGKEVREVHVISAEGECKELAVWLQRGWEGGYDIIAGDIRFRPEDEKKAVPVLCPDAGNIHGLLFEPSSSLLKSGAFNLICSRYGLSKLGRFTHLYICDRRIEALDKLGKWFSINETRPFDGRSIKLAGHDFPRCEVTARNIPMSSDELRRRMGVTSGGSTHIFAVSADFSAGAGRRIIIVTERI